MLVLLPCLRDLKTEAEKNTDLSDNTELGSVGVAVHTQSSGNLTFSQSLGFLLETLLKMLGVWRKKGSASTFHKSTICKYHILCGYKLWTEEGLVIFKRRRPGENSTGLCENRESPASLRDLSRNQQAGPRAQVGNVQRLFSTSDSPAVPPLEGILDWKLLERRGTRLFWK